MCSILIFIKQLIHLDRNFTKQNLLLSSIQPKSAETRGAFIMDKADPKTKKLEGLFKIVLLVIFLMILWATGKFVLSIF
jgi:hypothetical protein